MVLQSTEPASTTPRKICHLQFEEGGQEAQQLWRQEGAIDAPLPLGSGRHKAYGLPCSQQRRVLQQSRALQRGFVTVLCRATLGSIKQLCSAFL